MLFSTRKSEFAILTEAFADWLTILSRASGWQSSCVRRRNFDVAWRLKAPVLKFTVFLAPEGAEFLTGIGKLDEMRQAWLGRLVFAIRQKKRLWDTRSLWLAEKAWRALNGWRERERHTLATSGCVMVTWFYVRARRWPSDGACYCPEMGEKISETFGSAKALGICSSRCFAWRAV